MARLLKLAEPVLVTGAAGFIGRRLVNRLLHDGIQVRAFDCVACPESLMQQQNLSWYQGDIRHASALNEAMQDCGTVFHLAAMVGDWGDPESHRQVTVEGTRHCFERAMQQAKVRVVLASSIVVYGDQIGLGVCHEALPHGLTFGPYSECKQAQERLAQRYLQQGLDVRIVRPANVYGAGCKPWVEQLCEELKRGVPVLIDGGNYPAGLVHVDNVVDILLRAARVADSRGQIFNAADEEEVTWRRYMCDLAQLCGAPAPRSLPRVAARSLAWAGERAYKLLGSQRRPPITREALNLVGSPHQISMDKTRSALRYRPFVSYQEGLAEIEDYLGQAQ